MGLTAVAGVTTQANLLTCHNLLPNRDADGVALQVARGGIYAVGSSNHHVVSHDEPGAAKLPDCCLDHEVQKSKDARPGSVISSPLGGTDYLAADHGNDRLAKGHKLLGRVHTQSASQWAPARVIRIMNEVNRVGLTQCVHSVTGNLVLGAVEPKPPACDGGKHGNPIVGRTQSLAAKK